MRRVTLMFALYSKLMTRFPFPFPIPCCLLVAKRSWNHDTTLFFGEIGVNRLTWQGQKNKKRCTDCSLNWCIVKSLLQERVSLKKNLHVTSSKFSLQLGTWFVLRCMVQWNHLTIFFFWGGGVGNEIHCSFNLLTPMVTSIWILLTVSLLNQTSRSWE